MKKCISTLGLLLMLFSSSSSFAQSEEAFKKNDIIITGGFGLGFGYGYQNYSTTNFYYNYGYGYDYDFRLNFTLGTIFPVNAEYALSNKFGIGLAYQRGNYVNTNTDKSTANSFGAFGAFHFLSREKIELYTRLTLGYSMLDYIENPDYYGYYNASESDIPTSNNSFRFTPKGWYAKPSFGMRLYFTEHLGMFADFGIGVYSYRTNTVETDQGTYDLNKNFRYVVINGELTTGLAFKF